MTNDDFNVLADSIGPKPGAVREALRAHFVSGMRQIDAASQAGINRGPMSKYVKIWTEALIKLTGLDWEAIKTEVSRRQA